MNQKLLDEFVMVRITRDARMKIKVLAALRGMNISEYLQAISSELYKKEVKQS